MSDDDEGYFGDGEVHFPPFTGLYEGCDKIEMDNIMELMTHYRLIRFPCYLFTLKQRRHIKLRLSRVVSKALRVKRAPLIILRHFANILIEERDQIFRFVGIIYNLQNPTFHFWFLNLRAQFHFLNANDCDDMYFDALRQVIHNISSNNTYSKFCITMVLIDKVLQRVVKWFEDRYLAKFDFATWYFIDAFDYSIEDCDVAMDPGLYLPFDDDVDLGFDSSTAISSSAEDNDTDSDSSFDFNDTDDSDN